jgi:hypothetical protein
LGDVVEKDGPDPLCILPTVRAASAAVTPLRAMTSIIDSMTSEKPLWGRAHCTATQLTHEPGPPVHSGDACVHVALELAEVHVPPRTRLAVVNRAVLAALRVGKTAFRREIHLDVEAL